MTTTTRRPMSRGRRLLLVVMAALMLATPPTIAAAATHWHRMLQPVHHDRDWQWLGTPFPFFVDYQGTSEVSGCLHTDRFRYVEKATGASDYHWLRHAHC